MSDFTFIARLAWGIASQGAGKSRKTYGSVNERPDERNEAEPLTCIRYIHYVAKALLTDVTM